LRKGTVYIHSTQIYESGIKEVLAVKLRIRICYTNVKEYGQYLEETGGGIIKQRYQIKVVDQQKGVGIKDNQNSYYELTNKNNEKTAITLNLCYKESMKKQFYPACSILSGGFAIPEWGTNLLLRNHPSCTLKSLYERQ